MMFLLRPQIVKAESENIANVEDKEDINAEQKEILLALEKIKNLKASRFHPSNCK